MSVTQVNNLRIIPGTDFEVTFNISSAASDSATLVGSAVTVAQIGKWPGSDNQFNFNTQWDEDTGELNLKIPNTITTQLENGRNYYSVDLIRNDKIFRIIEGTAIVER